MSTITVKLNHDQDKSIDQFVSSQLNKGLSEITIADIEQYLAMQDIKYDYLRFTFNSTTVSVITGPMDKINWLFLII